MATKHVLDTHALVWYLEGNPRLGKAARAAIEEPDADLVLPIIALAEAAFIVERGRTAIPTVAALLQSVLADERIDVHPLTWDVFEQSLTLLTIPEMHDRLIVATALHLLEMGHVVTLLTADRVLAAMQPSLVIW